MWGIFCEKSKELKFQILKVMVHKDEILKYHNYIKAKCLNDNLVFDIYVIHDENLSKTENKKILKSVLIEEYNKILKEKELSIKRIHEGDVI